MRFLLIALAVSLATPAHAIYSAAQNPLPLRKCSPVVKNRYHRAVPEPIIYLRAEAYYNRLSSLNISACTNTLLGRSGPN